MGAAGIIYIPKKLRPSVEEYIEELKKAQEQAIKQASRPRPGRKSNRDF